MTLLRRAIGALAVLLFLPLVAGVALAASGQPFAVGLAFGLLWDLMIIGLAVLGLLIYWGLNPEP